MITHLSVHHAVLELLRSAGYYTGRVRNDALYLSTIIKKVPDGPPIAHVHTYIDQDDNSYQLTLWLSSSSDPIGLPYIPEAAESMDSEDRDPNFFDCSYFFDLTDPHSLDDLLAALPK